MASAAGIANALATHPNPEQIPPNDMRDALYGIGLLLEEAQSDIDATLQSSIEEAAQALAAERAARPPEKATKAQK
jgi:hypothetical protein